MELCQFCQVSNVSTVIRFSFWLVAGVTQSRRRPLWIVGGLVRCCSWQWSNWFGFAGVILEDGVMWKNHGRKTRRKHWHNWAPAFVSKWGDTRDTTSDGSFNNAVSGFQILKHPAWLLFAAMCFHLNALVDPRKHVLFPRVDQPCLLWNVCSLPNHWGTIVNKHPKLALKSTKMERVNLIFTYIYQVHTVMLDINLCYKWHAHVWMQSA